MARKMSLYEKHLQNIAESIGEDLIPFLSEEIVKQIPPEKRVRGLTLSERLGGLTDEVLRSLSLETREKLLQLLNQPDGNRTEFSQKVHP